MVQELFDDWRPEDATLLSTDVRTTEYDPIDVEVAASSAKDILEMEHPDDDGYVIPLFAIDAPYPTDEYVIYRPESSQIGWFDAGFGSTGTERFADCERLSDKEIGHRLRLWLPENQSQATLEVDESKLPNERIDPTDRLNSDEQAAFFEDLKEFVRSERETERESNWESYQELGLQRAIDRNQMSGPFVHMSRSIADNGQPAYNYQLLEDDDQDRQVDLRGDEGLFSENECIVDTEAEDEHFPLEAELLSVGDRRITVQPDWETIEDDTAVESILNSGRAEIWLHELLNPVPYDRRLDAIRQVQEDDEKRDLLTGRRPVEFTVNKYAPIDSDVELNEYQRLAMVWADGADDVVCIHGPPGTGKTRTLSAYVRQAVKKGESVLVTAHSNQAVDNLLVGDSTPGNPEESTLHAMALDEDISLSIARVGNNSRNRVVQQNYVNRSTSGADVVAATTSGAAKFDPDTFDVAVVDEATQASRPATAIVLNSARKLVLAGDHKQLPPYCADESMQEEDMHISLFEYLLNRYDDEISVLLQKQYRMNEEIAAFPNQAFYGGDLETADDNRDWTIDDLKPIMGVEVQGEERRPGNSYYNQDEAEAVARQVQLLVQSGVEPEDIGVISAYSGQIGKIIHQVNQLDIPNPRAVSVDTVDSFQGSEREAIIVSLVRSNADGYSGFLEFPEEGPRRLNVALTRARKRLVLVGNWDTLGTVAPHRTADESCADLYADLAEHLRATERMLSPGS